MMDFPIEGERGGGLERTDRNEEWRNEECLIIRKGSVLGRRREVKGLKELIGMKNA